MTTNPTSNADMISLLNPDLLHHVAGFLGAKDALSFSAVSKAVQQGLSLSPTNTPLPIVSSPDLHFHGDYTNGDDPLFVASIPVQMDLEKIHSVVLQCQWKDQGWGNDKGRMIIVGHQKRVAPGATDVFKAGRLIAQTGPAPRRWGPIIVGRRNRVASNTAEVFQAGRLVAQAGPAPREWSPMELTFVPKEGEFYSIWCSAGGGGGHELFVRDAAVSIVNQATQIQNGESMSISKPPVPIRFWKDVHLHGSYSYGDDPELIACIPVLLDPKKIHTIVFQCQWQDQGWRNGNGGMYILGHTERVTSNTVDKFQRGRVVACAGSAPQRLGSLELTFVPQEDEFYSLWCKAGLGGGQHLFVRGASISALIQNDDKKGTQKKIYRERAALFVPPAVEPRQHQEEDVEDLFADDELVMYDGEDYDEGEDI